MSENGIPGLHDIYSDALQGQRAAELAARQAQEDAVARQQQERLISQNYRALHTALETELRQDIAGTLGKLRSGRVPTEVTVFRPIIWEDFTRPSGIKRKRDWRRVPAYVVDERDSTISYGTDNAWSRTTHIATLLGVDGNFYSYVPQNGRRIQFHLLPLLGDFTPQKPESQAALRDALVTKRRYIAALLLRKGIQP